VSLAAEGEMISPSIRLVSLADDEILSNLALPRHGPIASIAILKVKVGIAIGVVLDVVADARGRILSFCNLLLDLVRDRVMPHRTGRRRDEQCRAAGDEEGEEPHGCGYANRDVDNEREEKEMDAQHEKMKASCGAWARETLYIPADNSIMPSCLHQYLAPAVR
jgi:hypothetical protein